MNLFGGEVEYREKFWANSGKQMDCTVADRVMKSYLNYIPYNQYYPMVHTKKCYSIS